MKYNDIAVIGMSLLMPGAENTDELHVNLAAGKDLVRKVPESRFRLHGLDPEKEYIESGYLEHIEMFDNKFFNISDYEAKVMAPEQRLSLELSAKAIEDAGYSLSGFRGKNCGVFFAASNSDGYYSMTERKTSTSAIGTVKSMITGKIGYYFDLTGANIIYDTGCSSALVAVHEACIKLMTGEIDYALVGGIHVLSDISESQPDTYDVMGLGSSDYHCRSFDASASGVGLGEGGGVVILKRLSDAEKDRDPVYAVVKSGCVNGDGGRCSSATIPSVEGQREVIWKSWNDYPEFTVTEIEAHGIGTKIGDSVEAQSIMECLKRREKTEGKVYLSCVKSSVGHLVEAAGISSMIKAITGFENNITYKIANFNEPNPAIDFASSVLSPVKENIYWNGTEKRAAGIDSFGLSGANVHIVIEKYIRKKKNNRKKDFNSFIKLSAKTKTSFFAIREKLLSFLDCHSDIDMRDFVCTLNSARDDYKFRRAVYVENAEELRDALEQISPASVDDKNTKYVFCMKADKDTLSIDERIKELLPSLSYESGISDDDTDLKYKFFKLFTEMGIKPDIQLIDKTSKLIVAAAENGCSADIADIGSGDSDGDYSKIISIINGKSVENDIVLINFGSSTALKAHEWEHNVKVCDLSDYKDIRRFIINYYNAGNDINWSAAYSDSEEYNRIHVPGYEFDKISHWGQEKASGKKEKTSYAKPVAVPAAVQAKPVSPEPVQNVAPVAVPEPQPEIQQPVPVVHEEKTAAVTEAPLAAQDSELMMYCEKMEEIWRNEFDFNDKIGYDEDFFDLGGNSLMMQHISTELNKVFDTEFDIYEIYDNPTISQLSERLLEFIKNE